MASPLVDMSQAIRKTVDRHAEGEWTLETLPEKLLRDFTTILVAYAADFSDALVKRESSDGE